MAYDAIGDMLGPASFADLRNGAKDPDASVRAQAVCDVYNMLELESEPSQRRWPAPSDARIAEVRAFLAAMASDQAALVRDSARTMLIYIAQRRP
jgi:hypothetical protein